MQRRGVEPGLLLRAGEHDLEVVVAGWRGAAGFSQVATQVINPKLVPKVGPKLSTMERYLTTGIRVTTAKAPAGVTK